MNENELNSEIDNNKKNKEKELLILVNQTKPSKQASSLFLFSIAIHPSFIKNNNFSFSFYFLILWLYFGKFFKVFHQFFLHIDDEAYNNHHCEFPKDFFLLNIPFRFLIDFLFFGEFQYDGVFLAYKIWEKSITKFIHNFFLCEFIPRSRRMFFWEFFSKKGLSLWIVNFCRWHVQLKKCVFSVEIIIVASTMTMTTTTIMNLMIRIMLMIMMMMIITKMTITHPYRLLNEWCVGFTPLILFLLSLLYDCIYDESHWEKRNDHFIWWCVVVAGRQNKNIIY